MSVLVGALLAVLGTGCDETQPVPSVDDGGQADSGSVDAGPPDAGDGGPMDSGIDPVATCSGPEDCEPGAVCVPAVAEGSDGDSGRCEPPHVVYSILLPAFTGGVASRAIEMMAEGLYRLPRGGETLGPEVPDSTFGYAMMRADGTAVDCPDGVGSRRPCIVPNWSALIAPWRPDGRRAVPNYRDLQVGEDYRWVIPSKYNRFDLFGLRPLRYLLSTALLATDAQLAETGFRRRDFENAALAFVDSYLTHGRVGFAQTQDPAPGEPGGHQNPNRSWADPDGTLGYLSEWNPAQNENARTNRNIVLPLADPNPNDGFGEDGRIDGLTGYALRESAAEKHALAFLAQMLSLSYQTQRGLHPAPERYREAVRQLGADLSLPRGLETEQNHGISQSLALMVLAHHFAGTDEQRLPRGLTDAWLRLGRHRLNDVIGDTVYRHGVHAEDTGFYHGYQQYFMIEIARWLDAQGLDLSDGVVPMADLPEHQRIDWDPSLDEPNINRVDPDPSLVLLERGADGELSGGGLLPAMLAYTAYLVQPTGWVPETGTGVPVYAPEYQDHIFLPFARSLAHTEAGAAALFSLTLGEEGAPPSTSSRLFYDPLDPSSKGAHAVLRSGWRPFSVQTHVHVQLGTPSHGHSHLGTGGFVLSGPNPVTSEAPGRVLLEDSGWFSYQDDRRRYFEGTPAHNTVSIDGQNQCSLAWTSRSLDALDLGDAPARDCATVAEQGAGLEPGQAGYPAGRSVPGLSLLDEGATGGWVYQSLQHGLYPGVSHRRGLLLLEPGALLIVDEVVADRPVQATRHWHGPRGLTPAQVRATASTTEGGAPVWQARFRDAESGVPLMTLQEVGTRDCQVYHGAMQGERFARGWHSSRENQAEASLELVCSSPLGTRALTATLFLFGARAGTEAELELTDAGDRLHLEIQLGEACGPRTIDIQRLGQGETAGENLRVGCGEGSVFENADRWWPMEDASSMVPRNGTSVGRTEGLQRTDGFEGSGYAFEDGRVELDDALDELHQQARFTLAFALRRAPGTVAGTEGLFSTAAWSEGATGIKLYARDGTQARFTLEAPEGPIYSTSLDDYFVADGQYHLYMVVVDDARSTGAVRFYRDGALIGDRSAGGRALPATSADGPITVGAKPGAASFPLRADLDDLALFLHPLSESEVLRACRERVSAATSPLNCGL